jgi:imidazolonepropionase-like amidohydrolase
MIAKLSLYSVSKLKIAVWFALAAPFLSAQSLVIKNISVVDVAAGSVKAPANVVIKDGKIASIGAKFWPADATDVDGSGKYLIPGLWDMHVHNWEKTSLYGLYVANGVLGIRDTGSNRAMTRQWQEQVKTGEIIGPRLVTSGPIVDGPGPNNYPKLPVETIATPADVPMVVDRLMQSGSDFIKPLSRLDRDSYFALLKYANERHIVVAGHVPSAISVWEAVRAGQHSVEHMQMVPLACSTEEPEIRKEMAEAAAKKDREATLRLRQRVAETFSQEHCTALFREMKKSNAWIDPTFVSGWLRWRIATGEAQKDTNVRFVPQYLRAEWADPSNHEDPPTAAQQEQERKDEEARKRMVLAMKTANVGILIGSDTGDPYVLPGFVVHQEMALLVEYGLTPAEALRASTLEPARYFGITASEGTVEKGKNANLVIVDANPLADISNTRRVDAVILGGRLLKRDQLDALLQNPK